MPGRIWQHECDGWYIYSNISNGTKAEDLKRISDHFHLGLKIEEGKPEYIKTHSSSFGGCIKQIGLRVFKDAFCDLEACSSARVGRGNTISM